MGFQNRDYARSGSVIDGVDTPATRGLILVTIVVFVLQILFTRTETFEIENPIPRLQSDDAPSNDPEVVEFSMQVPVVQQWLELKTSEVVRGQVWRLLTYAFCHSRSMLWHIVINMAVLWWMGPALEAMYGAREFLYFYLLAAVVSGIANVALDLATGSSGAAIGASGAVMGVTALFSHHFPTQKFRIMMLFSVEMRWAVWIYAAYDLLPVLWELSGSGKLDGIAHAAHLGGLAFGLIYSRQQWQISRWAERFMPPARRGQTPLRPERVAPPSTHVASVPQAPKETSSLRDEASQLDEVLAKLHEQGSASLTQEEQDVLYRESERLRKRRQV